MCVGVCVGGLLATKGGEGEIETETAAVLI